MIINDFTGFVLVGGKSSRMGMDKFTLKFGGKTFLEHAVDTLKPICQTVKIVLNQTQTIETIQPIIRDIYGERGAPGGIHAGLINCPTKFAVFLAIDLPFVTTDTVEKIIKNVYLFDEYDAFVPRQNNERAQPLCAVYRVKDCLPPLEKLLNETVSASVGDFLNRINVKFIEERNLDSDEKLFCNINRPADFDKITD